MMTLTEKQAKLIKHVLSCPRFASGIVQEADQKTVNALVRKGALRQECEMGGAIPRFVWVVSESAKSVVA